MKKIFDEGGRLLKAGGVIVRERSSGGKELLLVSEDGKSYSFPKGHLEEGETLEECAVRECLEETGLQIQIVKRLPELKYQNTKTGDNIEVHLYKMKVIGGDLDGDGENIDMKWVPIAETEKYFTYQSLKDYMTLINQFL